VVDLSAFYFDVLKDRLYTFAPNSVGRRSAQTAIWRILEAMTRLLAPILSFTADEVWRYLPSSPSRPLSVHLDRFPEAEELFGDASVPESDAEQQEAFTTLVAVREPVLKALEEARNRKLIGKGLEAQVSLGAADPVYSVLARYQDQLRYLFIVSAVELEQAPSANGVAGVKVEVARAAGKKCERCWNYSTHVGEDPAYPTICERCSPVLKQIAAGATASESKRSGA